jgi:hypothetical protein
MKFEAFKNYIANIFLLELIIIIIFFNNNTLLFDSPVNNTP